MGLGEVEEVGADFLGDSNDMRNLGLMTCF